MPAPPGFMCAQVHSSQEAMALLHVAKSYSSNWTTDRKGCVAPVPNKAHLFVRVDVSNSARQQVSTLHVIDLAGSQKLGSHGAKEQQHLDKLITNQQLLSFSKVVTELSRMSASSGRVSKPAAPMADACNMMSCCKAFQLPLSRSAAQCKACEARQKAASLRLAGAGLINQSGHCPR